MSSAKMQWTKPQLIVLTRGMPEESVLSHCKTQNPNHPGINGPTDYMMQDVCAFMPDKVSCRNCQSRALNAT